MADIGNKEVHVLWAEGDRGMGGRQWETETVVSPVLGSGIITYEKLLEELVFSVALNAGCSPQLAGELLKNISA